MGAAKQQATDFVEGMDVVYPAHGVGKVLGIVDQEIAGFMLELLVVKIPRCNDMTLRIPRKKAVEQGLRPVSSRAVAEEALGVLEGRARRSRQLWSKRAQDYESKINSGDILIVAEVVRDLSRGEDTDSASYSEKTLFEQAMERLTSELAIALGITETEATARVTRHLSLRPARGPGRQAEDAEDEADDARAA